MQIFLTGSKSIYEEIVDSVERYIKLGVLKKGEQLPSVRDLALQLSINPNTVSRAYEKLVENGEVSSIPKKGYFVATSRANHNPIKAVIDSLIEQGFSLEEIERVIEEEKAKK